MKRILVIGATGNIGRQVVSQLAERGDVAVRAMARNPESAGLPEVEVVRGDLTVPESLDACLDGVDAVFLLWFAPAATVIPVLERITKQARRVVFLSSPHQTPHPFFQRPQPNLGAELHKQIEGLIAGSTVEWTFLRPGIFANNSREWWAPQIRAGNVVRWPYAASHSAPIDERDIAAVAVRALCEAGHAGAEYMMTAPEALTHAEQVETIGRVIGRPLRMEEISVAEAKSELAGIFPAPVLRMLMAAWAGGVEQPALITTTVEEITGKRARTFEEWVKDHADYFR